MRNRPCISFATARLVVAREPPLNDDTALAPQASPECVVIHRGKLDQIGNGRPLHRLELLRTQRSGRRCRARDPYEHCARCAHVFFLNTRKRARCTYAIALTLIHCRICCARFSQFSDRCPHIFHMCAQWHSNV